MSCEDKRSSSFEGSFEGLPGGEIVAQGLADLERHTESKYTLLLSIAGPRLRGLGISIPEANCLGSFEHRLYSLLELEYGNSAHARYNSLVRRIVSFARSFARESARRS